MCGDSTPSVPPDMMNNTRRASPLTRSRSASIALYAVVAKPRLQSFTQPLPSVLPSTQMMSRGSITPCSISSANPLTSSGADE